MRSTSRTSGSTFSIAIGAGIALVLMGALDPLTVVAQTPSSPTQSDSALEALTDIDAVSAGGSAARLARVPVGNLVPGATPLPPAPTNPVAGDPQAAQRGMTFFTRFNCVGCHAANAGGGMGPSLSNHKFIYGDSDANLYLSILQGRPNGMPAWGYLLPDSTIWDLVAYIHSLSNAPSPTWGTTTSPDGFDIEQVPAEKIQTADPWAHTEKFSYGKKPQQEGEPAAAGGG